MKWNLQPTDITLDIGWRIHATDDRLDHRCRRERCIILPLARRHAVLVVRDALDQNETLATVANDAVQDAAHFHIRCQQTEFPCELST